jgi:hypothetical protein
MKKQNNKKQGLVAMKIVDGVEVYYLTDLGLAFQKYMIETDPEFREMYNSGRQSRIKKTDYSSNTTPFKKE